MLIEHNYRLIWPSWPNNTINVVWWGETTQFATLISRHVLFTCIHEHQHIYFVIMAHIKYGLDVGLHSNQQLSAPLLHFAFHATHTAHKICTMCTCRQPFCNLPTQINKNLFHATFSLVKPPSWELASILSNQICLFGWKRKGNSTTMSTFPSNKIVLA